MSCTAKNRIRNGSLIKAKCGQCGQLLYPDLSAAEHQREAISSSQQSNSAIARNRNNGSFPSGLVVFVFLAGLWFLGTMDKSPDAKQTSSSASKPVATQEILPEPVLVYAGLVWNKTGRSPQAPFQIVTRGGHNFFVKLVDANSDADAVAVYVPGGQTVEIEVPLGTYKLRYAAGKTWRGEEHFFGPGQHTSFSEASSLFEFEVIGNRVTGYTVELFLQTDGNLHTKGINRSQF